MPSIKDFVDHRWEDAKTKLTQLDRNFVHTVETAVNLEKLGLVSASPPRGDYKPQKSLPTVWHDLLEECSELTTREWILRTSADCLTSAVNQQMDLEEAGKRSIYHFRSWFAHAKSLSEEAYKVGVLTSKVYLKEGASREKINREFKEVLRREVDVLVSEQRNTYLHGRGKSWYRGITEEDGWEEMIAAGMTPEKFLTEFEHPTEGVHLQAGKHNAFACLTVTVTGKIGVALEGLETAIAGFCSANGEYRNGPER